MAISRGPRRLAGLQRTRAAYANEAALAISGRAARRGRRLRDPGARPAPPHIAGSALFGARLRPGGPGAALAAAAARTQAQSVCAAARAPRRAPPPPPGAPPGAGGRGQGSGRRLCLSGALGRRASCSPGAEGRPAACLHWSSAFLRTPAPLGLRWCPSLRTFSPGSCPLFGLPRRPARPGGSRPERSGVRTPGWRDFGKTNFPVRKRRGPRGSSPPLPSDPLPSAPTPVSPPPPPPPPTPGPSTPERPPRPPPPPGLPRPFARPPGLRAACGSLNPGTGRGPRGFASHPQFRSLMGAVPGACGVGRERRVPGGLATESSKSTKVPRVAHRVLDFWG
ncbi:basic proline-rich protein-like [Bos taurus]|uniref:basic proline-rich protein-like n=1 Tax=Bos taurus TaxID=9913 RepID=UPI0028CBBB31|nr:basic proline-rich protein-like [Bos taurus]